MPARREARQERAIMAGADVIVTNAPNARRALAQAFPACGEKIVAIANGYDPEPFNDRMRVAPVGSDHPITILHPGQLYFGRDPRPFLDGLRDFLAQRSPGARPVRFELIGHLQGDARSFDIADAIRTRNLEGVVSVGGQVPYDQCLASMIRADILLLLDTPGRRIGVPAKLYEYVGAGRPVLALGEPDGDTAWVLQRCGTPHRIVPCADSGAIRQALAELIGEIESGRPMTAGTDGRLEFTRERLAGQLVEILSRCTERGGLALTKDQLWSESEARPAQALAGEHPVAR
jgi:glycosyltransferase involved in cell wall biosynthesis